MPKFFTLLFKYKAFLLFVFYCSIALFFIKLETDGTFDQLSAGGSEFSASINEQLIGLTWLFNVRDENEQLMRVNRDLLMKVLKSETSAIDERNREKIVRDSTFNANGFTIAKVVDRKFSDRENMLVIDAGWSRGVKPDMTVLVPQGLVGRVVAVSENYAKVMPIIHTDFKASVVSDSSNTMGILSWKGGSEGFAQVEHIPISSRLKVNEQMLTSDFSTFALRGIPVGRVARIKPDKLFYNIDLRLAVDFSSISYVLVAPLKIESEKVVILNDSTTTQVP